MSNFSPALDRHHKKSPKGVMQDCLILLVSLVLTEPKTTPKQQKMIASLIKRLRPFVEEK